MYILTLPIAKYGLTWKKINKQILGFWFNYIICKANKQILYGKNI